MGMRNIAAAFLLGLCALAGHAATYEPALDLTLPDEIGGLPLAGRQEFPQKELGVGLAYKHEHLLGSVFIYTAGLRSLPSGADSQVVRRHFAQVVADVKQLQADGKYHAVTLVGPSEQTTTYPGCGPQFLVREFILVMDDGITRSSQAYLTVVNGNFVKLRITDRGGATNFQRDAERFVLQLRKLLGKCPP